MIARLFAAALFLIGLLCIGQSDAFWQSRDSNYNLAISGGFTPNPGFVQGTNCESTGAVQTLTCTYSGAVTAQDMLYGVIRWAGTTDTLSVASDSVNSNWTLIDKAYEATQTGDWCYVYSFPNTAAGTPTFTATFTGTAAALRIAIGEWKGIVTSNTVDAHAIHDNSAGGGVGTTIPGVSISTAIASDTLIAGFCSDGGNATITDNASGSLPASGWTNRLSTSNQAGTLVKIYASDNQVSTTNAAYIENWGISVGTDNQVVFTQGFKNIIAWPAPTLILAETLRNSEYIWRQFGHDHRQRACAFYGRRSDHRA